MREKKKLDIKELIKNSIPIIIFVAIMGVVTIIFWPYIEGLATDEGRAQFKEWIDGIGFWGWLATLAIQLLQIFVAFIPGEPVELILPSWHIYRNGYHIFRGEKAGYALRQKDGRHRRPDQV